MWSVLFCCEAQIFAIVFVTNLRMTTIFRRIYGNLISLRSDILHLSKCDGIRPEHPSNRLDQESRAFGLGFY